MDTTLQLALEQEMFRASAEKLRADIAKAKSRNTEDETPYASRLMTAKIEAVSLGIAALVERWASGEKALRSAKAVKFISLLEPEVCAALALKGVLAGITKRRTLQNCGITIGRMVEDELAWRAFETQAPDEAKITAKKISTKSSYAHRRRIVGVMAARVEVARPEWTDAERLSVGVKLAEIVQETTAMITFEKAKASAKAAQMIYVTTTPETLTWIEKFVGWYAAVSPEWWPMIVPPKPWDGPWGGGYYSRIPRPIPLVKRAKRGYLEELANVDMPDVYTAINTVQNTGYAVDKWTLDVIEQVWASGVTVAGLPSREPVVVPNKPHDIDTNAEARLEWRKKAAMVYDGNIRILSKRLQLDQGLKMARRFSSEEAIYFPHQFDFRGRIYAICGLSYQGPDWMKGLLKFSSGKPIENVNAAGYLMMQGASLWGADKGSLDDRMAWVEENSAAIIRAGTDPLSDYWWADADKPWQFLQWCHEWATFSDRGYGFVSSFICSADGTCNGLQHFSAMLRDEVGGAAVNLVPGDKPADIYRRVAEVVTAKLSSNPSDSVVTTRPPLTDAEWSRRWLSFGIDRKITKRAVMVLPYGGTQYSTREFIEEAIHERGGDTPFGHITKDQDEKASETDGAFAASLFLAAPVWDAIGEVVIAARVAMGWLKKVASLVAAEGHPVTWRTADGFPVQQAYYDTRTKRVELILAGVCVKLVIREELPTISKRRQEQGVSPNFVHSCDGTALRMYVNTAVENGIDSFALVHDSFGCVAADYETMQACLRSAFVDLYQSHDVMEEFRQTVEVFLPEASKELLPAVPPKGTLDIEAVKRSDFFFA